MDGSSGDLGGFPSMQIPGALSSCDPNNWARNFPILLCCRTTHIQTRKNLALNPNAWHHCLGLCTKCMAVSPPVTGIRADDASWKAVVQPSLTSSVKEVVLNEWKTETLFLLGKESQLQGIIWRMWAWTFWTRGSERSFPRSRAAGGACCWGLHCNCFIVTYCGEPWVLLSLNLKMRAC